MRRFFSAIPNMRVARTNETGKAADSLSNPCSKCTRYMGIICSRGSADVSRLVTRLFRVVSPCDLGGRNISIKGGCQAKLCDASPERLRRTETFVGNQRSQSGVVLRILPLAGCIQDTRRRRRRLRQRPRSYDCYRVPSTILGECEGRWVYSPAVTMAPVRDVEDEEIVH